MASRTWVAISLCLGIWVVYLKFFAPVTVPPAQVAQTEQTQTPGNTKEIKLNESGPSNVLFTNPIPESEDLNIKTEKLVTSFSSNGGMISEVKVLGYRKTISKDSDFITPVSPEMSSFGLATLFSDPKLADFSRAKYQSKNENKNVIFSHSNEGISVTKEYKLSDDSYAIAANFKISFPNSERRDWGYLMIPVGANALEYDAREPIKSWEVVAFQNDSVTRKDIKSLKAEEAVHQGNTGWIAFGNRYFATAVINQAELNPDVVLTKSKEFTGAYLRYPLLLKKGQSSLTFPLKIYVGPKDYAELNKFPGLKQLINYGMFSFLAYPLLEVLQFFYRFIHNYGIAIILLTILVRMIFYPLSLKSFKSMKDMQKLQPQIAALKEKHKEDMQKFNQEQMALFKAHKVNPAGGCLPMLMQLPVFIALYAVLGNSIELFHAPFFGWIHDLSSKDPLYIYPVLMGLSMLLQQKMTPNVGMDPAQRKMMYLMPLVFGFMMINLPSGLTVYIFVSTLLGILQQASMRDKKVITPVVA